MQKLILILTLLGLSHWLVAQQPGLADRSIIIVKGIVVDQENGDALAEASISVKDPGNKILSFIPRAGELFTVHLLRSRDYTLQFHLQGYCDTLLFIMKNDPPVIDLGKVGMRKAVKQLQEVVVRPPLTVQFPGKTLYRASEDPDAKSFMTFELLRKVPGITLDGRDQIRLNGNTNFRIFINGRPSNLFTRRPADVLKQFPASLIKDIEVISPPPARFDAEGVGGIINLVMLRSKVKGATGNLSLSYFSPFQAGQHVSLTSKYGKWGLQGFLSNSLGQNPVMPGATQMEDLTNDLRIQQTGSGGSQSMSRLGNLELSFEADAYDLFTLAFDASAGGNNSQYQQFVDLSDPSFASEYSEYRTKGSNLWRGIDLSFDYQRTSPVNSNRTFTVSLRQSKSADRSEDWYDENKLDLSEYFSALSNSKDHYLERTAQVDYFTPLKKHSFELGGKFIHRENYNHAYYGFSKEFSVVDDLQQISSGYTSLSLKLASWKIRLGARAEASRVEVLFRSDSTSVQRQYINFLPNLGLNKTIKKYGSLFFNYSQRIQRPGIHYLNPFVEYLDPYTISYGNPRLSPALFHSFNTGYSHSFRQSSLNTNLNYQFSGNSIVDTNEWGEDTVKRSTYGNLGTYRYAGFSIYGYLRLSDVLSMSLGGYLNYYAYSQGSREDILFYKGFTQTVTSGLSWRLKKGWSGAANYNYNGTQIQYQGKNKGYSFHSFTFNKNFTRPRMTFSLSLQNPFLKDRKNEYIVETSTFLQYGYQRVVMRRFSFSLTWNFGKLTSSVSKPGRTINNDDLMK